MFFGGIILSRVGHHQMTKGVFLAFMLDRDLQCLIKINSQLAQK